MPTPSGHPPPLSPFRLMSPTFNKYIYQFEQIQHTPPLHNHWVKQFLSSLPSEHWPFSKFVELLKLSECEPYVICPLWIDASHPVLLSNRFPWFFLQFEKMYLSIWTNTFSNSNKYILQFKQIHFAIQTNTFSVSNKYILQFQQIHLANQTNTFCNLNKYI